MKILAVSALLLAMMALTAATAVEKEEPEDEEAPAEELDVEKRTGHNVKWTWIGRRAFHYLSKPLTWDEAEKNCLSMGAHLAAVHSQEEHDQIRKIISDQAGGNTETWIGGSDSEQEGVWTWSNRATFKFTKWCRGEPNNGLGLNQDCLQMNWRGYDCWDDLQCSLRRPSLCAKIC